MAAALVIFQERQRPEAASAPCVMLRGLPRALLAHESLGLGGLTVPGGAKSFRIPCSKIGAQEYSMSKSYSHLSSQPRGPRTWQSQG